MSEVKLQLTYILADGGEMEVPETAWDEWVEPTTTIGALARTIWTHRAEFGFPADQSIGLHFDGEALDSRLDVDSDLSDARIPRQEVGGKNSELEVVTLWLRGWPPEWEIAFLQDFRAEFIRGRGEVPLTDGWGAVERLSSWRRRSSAARVRWTTAWRARPRWATTRGTI